MVFPEFPSSVAGAHHQAGLKVTTGAHKVRLLVAWYVLSLDSSNPLKSVWPSAAAAVGADPACRSMPSPEDGVSASVAGKVW
jgi:hypothetical protein